MKALITLILFIGVAANASYTAPKNKIQQQQAQAAPSIDPKAIASATPIQVVPAATPAQSPTEFALVTFPDTITSNQKVYITTYNSVNNKEEIRINLDCSIETNLKSVKTNYAYSLFKKYVHTICKNAILPVETK